MDHLASVRTICDPGCARTEQATESTFDFEKFADTIFLIPFRES